AEILCRVFNSFLPLLEEWDEERANDTNSYDQPETRYARTGEVFHESHDVGTKKSSEKPYSVDKCKPRGQPHSGKPRSRLGKENWPSQEEVDWSQASSAETNNRAAKRAHYESDLNADDCP